MLHIRLQSLSFPVRPDNDIVFPELRLFVLFVSPLILCINVLVVAASGLLHGWFCQANTETPAVQAFKGEFNQFSTCVKQSFGQGRFNVVKIPWYKKWLFHFFVGMGRGSKLDATNWIPCTSQKLSRRSVCRINMWSRLLKFLYRWRKRWFMFQRSRSGPATR